MGTTADKLNFTRNSLNELGEEMESKNPAFSKDMPLNEWKNYLPTSGGGWQRPASRPAVPVINAGEQVMYWLFGVSENSPNDFAITLSTSIGQYRMEWGDGTSNDYTSGTRAEHLFFYNSLIGTPTEEGYKWVWIKAYPLTGNFTGININVRHFLRPSASTTNFFIPQVFEWYLQAPYITTFAFSSSVYTRYRLLNIFNYKGANLITNFSYFASYWNNLQILNIDTSEGTNFSNFLSNCSSFNQLLNINTRNGTLFDMFLSSCSSFNQPLNIDTSEGTNFSNFLSNCSSFNQPLNIISNNGINFTYFIGYCYSFNKPLVIDLTKATTAIGTGFIGTSNFALKSLRLLNMGAIHTALTISNSSLDVDALVALFGDLYDRTGLSAGTLTITGVFGAARLTAEQKAIATERNWTIVG